MKAIFAAIKRSPKLAALVAVLVGVVLVPAALLAYGPDRPTFTMAVPADHITFDSITDNPEIGDERDFVGIREAGSNDQWSDNVTPQDGKSYVVRMYVHNNAASNLNLVAQDVRAKFSLPTNTAKSIEVQGFIDSSNATPNEVYDHATFSAGQDFNLAYQSGTLKFENNAFGAAGTPISESVFTNSGAKLGYDKLDGNIPGCNQYAGYLSFIVKPQFAPTTNFNVTKQVRKSGDTAWQKSVAVNNGDTVDYQLGYTNTGNSPEDNVLIQDALPAGINYIPGSAYLKNAANQTPLLLPDALTSEGVNVGNYTAGSNAYVKFSAKVNDQTLVCGTKTLTNKARVIVNSSYKEDTADVTITKPCQPGQTPPELPQTGISTDVLTFVGLGVVTAGLAYAVNSSRVRHLFRG